VNKCICGKNIGKPTDCWISLYQLQIFGPYSLLFLFFKTLAAVLTLLEISEWGVPQRGTKRRNQFSFTFLRVGSNVGLVK